MKCESSDFVSLFWSGLPEEVGETAQMLVNDRKGDRAIIPCEAEMEVGAMVDVRLKMIRSVLGDLKQCGQ